MDENQLRSSMQHAVELFATDISSIRTGRASSGLVENIDLAVYGGTQHLHLREVASITVPDSQLIQVTPWDKSIIGEIRKGIEAANLGFNPSIDGEIIRIVLPPMTGEDREKYIKLVNTKLESARVMIRQIRADAMQSLKKTFETKEITEDERKGKEKKVQEITDEFILKVEDAAKSKTLQLGQV